MNVYKQAQAYESYLAAASSLIWGRMTVQRSKLQWDLNQINVVLYITKPKNELWTNLKKGKRVQTPTSSTSMLWFNYNSMYFIWHK